MFYCSVIKVPVALTALIFYHISFSLSRTFLKSFSAIQLSRSFFDSHTRLSHLYHFVKNFLKLFYRPKSSFCCFKEPASARLSDNFCSLRQLCYNSISVDYCQQLFSFSFPTLFLSIGWVLIYHFLSSLSIIIAEKFYNFFTYF